jgi:hypothetical protein
VPDVEYFYCDAPHQLDGDEGQTFFPGEWYEFETVTQRVRDYVDQGWLVKSTARRASKKVVRAHEKALEEQEAS